MLLLLLLSLAASAAAAAVPLHLPSRFESHRAVYRDALPPAAETVVAEMENAGCLRHFWLTIRGIRERPENGLKLVLKIYFDGSRTPAVAVPAAPFFGIHHGHAAAHVNAPYLQVTDRGGFNSYFEMPYQRGMRIAFQNDGDEPLPIWFQADFQKYPSAEFREPLRFHATYRRVNPAQAYGQPFHVGHGEGRGFLAGLSLGVRVFDRTDHWYHCGGELVLLDGRTSAAHLLHGIGGEDFFGTAWGQGVSSNGPIGTPYYDEPRPPGPGDPPLWFAAYRFFDSDPIAFTDSFSMDFGSLANDMSAVLYWYRDGTAKPEPMASALRWTLCGPFSCENRAEFERREFPESGEDRSRTEPANFGVYADAAQRNYAPPARTRWVDGVAPVFRFVDLTPHFRARMKTNSGFPVNVSAYAATTVAAREDRDAVLRVGHDDWLRIWRNGKLIYDGKEKRGFRTIAIPVRLTKGNNRFLLKAANRNNTNYRAWVYLFDIL